MAITETLDLIQTVNTSTYDGYDAVIDDGSQTLRSTIGDYITSSNFSIGNNTYNTFLNKIGLITFDNALINNPYQFMIRGGLGHSIKQDTFYPVSTNGGALNTMVEVGESGTPFKRMPGVTPVKIFHKENVNIKYGHTVYDIDLATSRATIVNMATDNALQMKSKSDRCKQEMIGICRSLIDNLTFNDSQIFEVPEVTYSGMKNDLVDFYVQVARAINKLTRDDGVLSTLYNEAEVGTNCKIEDLILLINKEMLPLLNYDLLAEVFNAQKLRFDTNLQIKPLYDMGTHENTYAMLIDKNKLELHLEPIKSKFTDVADQEYSNHFWWTKATATNNIFKQAIKFKKTARS